ncbi:MAG: AEC family transporter [Peptococcaceae bacterium]|nr:AEC family transporter [Peptococcaceae bacterium]
MEAFWVIFEQLVAFFLMLLIGYVAARTKITTREFLDRLATLIMKLLLPIMIFANMMNGTSRAQLAEDVPALFLAMGIYGALIVIFALLGKVLRLPKDRAQIFQGVFVFGNVGFIGLPLMISVSPAHGAIYSALVSIVDQSLFWTYGLYLTTPSGQQASFSWRNFINPAVCGIALALALLLADVQVPPVLENGLLRIGSATTPLSLIYMGGLICYCNWTPVLRQKELYVGIAVKMLLFPLLFFAVASHFVANSDMTHTLTIVAGLPTMVAIAMFAQSTRKEGDYALGIVLATTMASLLTLSVVSYLIY